MFRKPKILGMVSHRTYLISVLGRIQTSKCKWYLLAYWLFFTWVQFMYLSWYIGSSKDRLKIHLDKIISILKILLVSVLFREIVQTVPRVPQANTSNNRIKIMMRKEQGLSMEYKIHDHSLPSPVVLKLLEAVERNHLFNTLFN